MRLRAAPSSHDHQRMSIIIPLLLCLLLVQPIKSWQEWHAKSHTLDTWKELWVLGEGPGERRGHSLILFNQSKIILFGGRGNDAHRPHVPKHFHVEEEGGVLDFTTYDDKPLSSAYGTRQTHSYANPSSNAYH